MSTATNSVRALKATQSNDPNHEKSVTHCLHRFSDFRVNGCCYRLSDASTLRLERFGYC